MNIFKKGITLVLSLGVAVSAFADAGSISGYFRVQNAGNGNYVEVSGPFTAKPNLSEEDALYSAGTVMYVEATQNGNAYEVTSLRCQGIDVVGQDAGYDEYQAIFDGAGSSNASSLVYGMFQQGFKYGYTTFARATVGSIFLFVASALDGYQVEGATQYTPAEFEALVNRFNEEVTATLDLGIRLAPVEGKTNTVQLYFDVPSFQPVCDWYQKEENYAMFTAATQAMTNYLQANGKGITLETFYPVDIQLFNEWGYDLKSVSGVEEVSDGNLYASFETIFKDPVLLFNWIKWVGYMILNPECESAEQHDMGSLGIVNDKLGDINLKGHYLTDMLISYLPRLHYNTRAYLINGKVVGDDNSVATGATYKWDSDADGTLGFANERELTNVAGENGNWVLVPVDNKTDNGKFMVNLPVEWTDEDGVSNNYAAVYYDFPVTAVDESATLSTLSNTTESMGYEYVELETQPAGVDARIAMIISSEAQTVQLNVADGDYTFSALDPSLFVDDSEAQAPQGSVPVTDEEAAQQRIKRRATTVSNSNFMGVLLPTEYFRITDYWNINPNVTPVYSLFQNDKVLSADHLLFKNSASNLAANQAIYLYPNTRNTTNMVIIGAPTIEVTVGEAEPDEDEPGEGNTPAIKIAQGFVGNGDNVFEGLISLPAELEYGTDFEITMTAPAAVNDGSNVWAAPLNPSDLNQSYYDAFLAIQPEPSDYQDEKPYVPALYSQYTTLTGEDNSVTIDGFYLNNLKASAESPKEDENGNYSYDLRFNAPCSGVYEMNIQGIGEYEGMTSGPHKVKIYPNLYGEFGPDKGFNINGYMFKQIEKDDGSIPNGSYVIYFPENYTVDFPTDLQNAVGYIPGTYFASSLKTDAPAPSSNPTPDGLNGKRRANAYPSAYYVDMNVADYLDQNKPLNVTIEKNGVSATYSFYLATSTTDSSVATGIESIVDVANGEAVYYNLHGVRVANPQKGIYIKVVDGKAEKVIL